MPSLAQLRPTPAHDVECTPQRPDTPTNPAAVGLELRLARSPGTDTAAQPRQGHTGANQPRQQILELRQLDLQLTFPRPGTRGKNVQDELRPVEYPAVKHAFEVAQLCRAQLVVEDHEIYHGLVARERQRLHLAPTKQQSRVRPPSLLQHPQHDCHAGRGRQTAQFFE